MTLRVAVRESFPDPFYEADFIYDAYLVRFRNARPEGGTTQNILCDLCKRYHDAVGRLAIYCAARRHCYYRA